MEGGGNLSKNKFVLFLLIVMLIIQVPFTTISLHATNSSNKSTDKVKIEVVEKSEQQIKWNIEVDELEINEEIKMELITSNGLTLDEIISNNEESKVEHPNNNQAVITEIRDIPLIIQVNTKIDDPDQSFYELKSTVILKDKQLEVSEKVDHVIVEDENAHGDIETSEEVVVNKREKTNDNKVKANDKLDELESGKKQEQEKKVKQETNTNNFGNTLSIRNISNEEVKSLTIDPDTIARNMQIETASGTRVDHKTRNIYENFNGTASKEISYSRRTFTPGELLTYSWNMPEIITVTYDHVGYVDVGSGNEAKYKDVGARLVISEIKLGAGPRWKQDDMVPRIELSNNFYSGILYQFIEEMKLEVQFFEKDNPQNVINFDGTNGQMSFLSLNGYGYVQNKEWGFSNLIYPGTNHYYEKTFEFAGSLDGVQGILSEPIRLSNGQYTKGTRLDYHPNGTTVRGNRPVAQQTYYMDKNLPPSFDNPDNNVNWFYVFEDRLGGEDFLDSGVTFPLSGTNHRFKIGSTYGYTWNSFMGVSVRATQHTAPSKTVQPLRTGGEESGYKHRYYNDLDRLHVHDNDVNHDDVTGESTEVKKLWELGEEFWVEGHNPKDLGKDEILQRYIKTGEEFYYFINQKAISLQTDSLVMPQKITFEDILPAGVTLASNSLEDLTLYNIDGSKIALTNREWSYDPNTRKLTVTLSERNTQKINELSQQLIEGDISLRIKSKATKKAIGNIDRDSMTNKAKTIFHYEKRTYDAESNRVQTAVRKIDVEKIWKDKNDHEGLRPTEITVGLRKKVDNKCSGNNLATIKLSEESGWKGSFESDVVGSGDYCVKELDIADNYIAVIDDPIEESESNFIVTITNKLLLTDLEFEKINEKGKKLKGATFVLLDHLGNEIVDKEGKPIHAESDENGKVTFKGLSTGKYKIKEIESPKGYQLDDTAYSFEVVKEADKLTIYYGNEWKEQQKIKNSIKPFTMELIKTDNEGNTLPGAEFTIYHTDNHAEVATVSSNQEGKVLFHNLKPGSYTIKETAGIPGFELSDLEVQVVIDEEGQVSLESSDEKTDISYEVELNDGKENNLIKVATPFINKRIDYQLIVSKVDKKLDEEGNTVFLEGATFVLLDKHGQEISSGTSDESGKIVFEKLTIGNYQLKEVKAPEGYRLLPKPIDIEITGDKEVISIEVENSKTGWNLPGVGGIGTMLFYALGALLLIGSLLVLLRQKASNNY